MTDAPSSPAVDAADSLDRLVDDLGITARRLADAIDAVIAGDGLAGAVQRSGLPRRTLERLLRIGAGAEALSHARETVAAGRSGPNSAHDAVVRMHGIIDAAPTAQARLDHVSATADTTVRRASWLADRFLLAGRRLVLMGDHDLTSLAAAPVLPDTEIVVVDVDEQLLDYIDGVARRDRLDITCTYADLTVSLPAWVRGSAGVVFTDPPYTPAGVATFVARSIEALDLRHPARIVMAYGFGPDHPALGLQVQRQLLALELAIESIEPGFNRYHAAEAIGSRSDLYVLSPTPRSVKAASKLTATTRQAIYTHGPRSLESQRTTLPVAVRTALLQRATITAPAIDDDRAIAWSRQAGDQVGEALTSTGHLFDRISQRRTGSVAASLLDGADAWLGRLLLTARADRVAMLVPNSHPDIADAAGQAALGELVAGRYELTLLRSQPTDHMAIVIAQRVADPQPTILDRPAASLRTALHDTIYARSRDGVGAAPSKAPSKADVSAMVDAVLAEIGAHYASVAVAELPRSVIDRVRSSM